MRAMTRWLLWVGMATGLVIPAIGCGGGDFGTTVDLPPAQRHKLPGTLKPGTVIKLPSAQPFNIHDRLWNSTPGPDGKANPLAEATAKGTALCKADGANGGSSTAEFQLGHCIDNQSGKAILSELRMSVDYEHGCQATGEGAATVSTYAVKAFVKDTTGKVIQTLPLASHSSDDGRINWSGTERTITEVTMLPGMGYYIVLAGQAVAGSQAKTSSSAHVKVKAFALVITCKPAASPPNATTTPAAKAK